MNDYLIEVDELHDLLPSGAIRLVDTRSEEEFNRSHIPGAVNIHDIFTYLCTRDTGGYPALVQHFARLFGEAGIQPSDQIVIYEDAMDNGYGQSCRGWFLFNYLGQSSVKVLHGGYKAWLSKKLPLSRKPAEIQPLTYQAAPIDSWMVTADDMLKAIKTPNVVIIDCRDYAEWVGANSSPYGYDYCPRKGRIPTARWIEWYRMMTRRGGIPWFKSVEDILKVCEGVGITPDTTVYAYCFKGARTSNTILAMKMAGIKDVRNYLCSWNEWSRDYSLPIDEDYPET